jgi:hypothetical protein
MDYHNMTRAELIKVARDLPKDRKIKQYYIKSRYDLIQLLTMNELPKQLQIEKRTLAQLRKEAQAKGIPKLWTYRRAELVRILYPGSKQDDKNDNDGKKHDNPQNRERKDVRVRGRKRLCRGWALELFLRNISGIRATIKKRRHPPMDAFSLFFVFVWI